jgi:hypothetical protein
MRKLFLLFFSLLSTFVFAQKGMVKGIVVSEKSGKPIFEALVTIKEAKVATSTLVI